MSPGSFTEQTMFYSRRAKAICNVRSLSPSFFGNAKWMPLPENTLINPSPKFIITAAIPAVASAEMDAFANAWDVASFELEDGTLIGILKDWDGERKKANFLREARKSACGIFRVTLSPDYNAAHRDHFHLDMGPGKSCR
jgi:hypothetical protein